MLQIDRAELKVTDLWPILRRTNSNLEVVTLRRVHSDAWSHPTEISCLRLISKMTSHGEPRCHRLHQDRTVQLELRQQDRQSKQRRKMVATAPSHRQFKKINLSGSKKREEKMEQRDTKRSTKNKSESSVDRWWASWSDSATPWTAIRIYIVSTTASPRLTSTMLKERRQMAAASAPSAPLRSKTVSSFSAANSNIDFKPSTKSRKCSWKIKRFSISKLQISNFKIQDGESSRDAWCARRTTTRSEIRWACWWFKNKLEIILWVWWEDPGAIHTCRIIVQVELSMWGCKVRCSSKCRAPRNSLPQKLRVQDQTQLWNWTQQHLLLKSS